jgi:hypothetical protein
MRGLMQDPLTRLKALRQLHPFHQCDHTLSRLCNEGLSLKSVSGAALCTG